MYEAMYPGTKPSKTNTIAPTICPYKVIVGTPASPPRAGKPDPKIPSNTTPYTPIVPWTVTAPTASSIPRRSNHVAQYYKITPAEKAIMKVSAG